MKRSQPTEPSADAAEPRICPFVATVNRQHAAAPPIEYPSFENHCLARDSAEPIALTEQATFCLAASHRGCPRFVGAIAGPERAAHASGPTGPSGPVVPVARETDMDFEHGALEAGARAKSGPDDARNRARRQKWSWIGAAMIFVSTLLCGGIFAVYVGWQIANSSYMAVQPGTVDTLSEQSQSAQPQIYLVVTATSEPNAQSAPPATEPQPGSLQASAASVQNIDPAQLPQAVTPTPGPNTGQQTATEPSAPAQNPGSVSLSDSAANLPSVQAETVSVPPDNSVPPEGSTQAGDPNLGALALDIPTRRPTPYFDIPTSTPAPAALEPIPTPIPPPSTPVVLINVEDDVLETGECTTISWNVENVLSVYFDSAGVNGHDEREVCMEERDLNYVLTVLYPDGSPHYFETTVEFLAPTPTPTPTFTFTPEPYLTPTWTPAPPTSTPTPDIQYGVQLASQSGNQIQCAADSTCELNLLVTNAGSGIDNLALQIVGRGNWPAELCRLDGVCDANTLIVAGMGPGNTALVALRVQVPALDTWNQQQYGLRATSQGSGQTVASNTLQLTLEAGP